MKDGKVIEMSPKSDMFASAVRGARYDDFYKTSGVRSDLGVFAPSLTRQEFAAECDINTIMARYESGGAVSHVNRATPMFLDTTQYPDLQGAMEAFKEAELAFLALPAKVRREFDNDPQKFVDAATDPEFKSKFQEWGLLEPEKVPEPPMKVEVVGQPPSAAPLGGAPQPAGAAFKTP